MAVVVPPGNRDPIKPPCVKPSLHFFVWASRIADARARLAGWGVQGSDNNVIVPGLYAAGEAGCASVHGANRCVAGCRLPPPRPSSWRLALIPCRRA